jgi:hypothetical protein
LTTAPTKKTKPRKYGAGLVLSQSEHRPHVHCDNRLIAWKPFKAHRVPHYLCNADLERQLTLMSHGWAKNTRSTYGWGLLLWHVWCDSRRISEELRAPTTTQLVLAFVADLAGSYSKSAIHNAVAGVHAWHDLHGCKWKVCCIYSVHCYGFALTTVQVDERRLALMQKGAGEHVPATSKQEQRRPILLKDLEAIAGVVDQTKPADVAFFACLLTTFWGTARLGEFVVPSAIAFNPLKHVKPNNVKQTQDVNGLPVFEFHVPRTKVADDGEILCFAPRPGATDPYAALLRHFEVNDPPKDGPLFAFRPTATSPSRVPLTRHFFLCRLKQALQSAGLDQAHGHSLRIGGTLQLLLEGVSFEAVKAKGRWKSNAFHRYLREHGAVMAQFIQAPDLERNLVEYSIPDL